MKGSLQVLGLMTAITILATLVPQAVAQTTQAPRSLTLMEAITVAVQQNQQLRGAALEVSIARAQLAQARAAASGQVNAQASYTRLMEQGPTTIMLGGFPVTIPAPATDLYDARLVLQYPLYTGGRIEAQVALAEANVKGAEATLVRLTQQIVFEVRQAYLRMLLAQSGVETAERSLAQATENLRVASARVAAGVSPRFDQVQAEVVLATARQALVRARNGVALAAQGLNVLLGLPLTTPLVLTDSFVVQPVRTAPDRLIATALETRPELAELRARQAAAAAAIQLAESGAKPSVVVNGAATYNNTTGLLAGQAGTASWSITLAATLNLYDGGLTRERVREAQLRLEQLKIAESQQRQAIEFEVRQAVLNLEAAREELAGADALVAQASEALRIAFVRFQSGVGTNLEVISAQASASQAESSKAQALFTYNLARASLERAVGGTVQ